MDIDYIAIGELPKAQSVPSGANVLIEDQGAARLVPASALGNGSGIGSGWTWSETEPVEYEYWVKPRE